MMCQPTTEVGDETESGAFYICVQIGGGIGYSPWRYRITSLVLVGCQGPDGEDLKWNKKM